ncbi:MAG TPA: hypothetical protein VFE55_14140 [Acidimicrobiia bacterium]|nr:hypothetical protein [Acidimicrobiia bacterium]
MAPQHPVAAPDDPGAFDMSDAEFGYQVILGATVGIVVTFVVMTVGLLATTGIGAAVPAMAWASIVGGGFFGGTVTVGLAMGRAEEAERRARAARTQRPPVTAPAPPARAA